MDVKIRKSADAPFSLFVYVALLVVFFLPEEHTILIDNKAIGRSHRPSGA